MTPLKFLEQTGKFTRVGKAEYFIETEKYGNYLWRTPLYVNKDIGGENTIRYTSRSLEEHLIEFPFALVYDVGHFVIKDFTGEHVAFTRPTMGRLSVF